MIFMVASIIWFLFDVTDNSLYWILKPVMTVSFFLLIYCYRRYFGKSILLQTLGKYSMPIYLVHPFLCILFSPAILTIPKTENITGVIMIILSQIIIIAFSYVIVVFIYKIKSAKRFLLPSSYREILNIC